MTRDKLRGVYADDVRGEICRQALRQLADGGPAAVSVNAIGRELGVSGPALYRYFSGRDALLTALIVEAYDDLAAAMSAAVAGRRTPRTRLRAIADAYRGWALAEPHRYRLLFRAPLPGYDPNADELVRASQSTMNVILDALAGAEVARQPAVPVSDWLRARDLPVELAAPAALALTVWSRLHGVVSLEIEGVWDSMRLSADALFAAEVDSLLVR